MKSSAAGKSPRRRFDPRGAAPFVNKSVSEAIRRAYGRAVREFFRFAGMKHPSEVARNDILLESEGQKGGVLAAAGHEDRGEVRSWREDVGLVAVNFITYDNENHVRPEGIDIHL